MNKRQRIQKRSAKCGQLSLEKGQRQSAAGRIVFATNDAGKSANRSSTHTWHLPQKLTEYKSRSRGKIQNYQTSRRNVRLKVTLRFVMRFKLQQQNTIHEGGKKKKKVELY